MPLVLERVEACKKDRLNGAEDRKKLADTPTLFRELKNPNTYIIVARHSSESRRYIPMVFLNNTYIPANSATIIPEANLYHFGILMSNVHMAWTRVVCGRIKSDYRYSKDIVYNNFPWCNPTEEQKTKIEQTAQAILDAREKYPDCSLADLYDETTMPPELRKAHQANDFAVMAAYGFHKKITESECVTELMKMYQKLVEGVVMNNSENNWLNNIIDEDFLKDNLTFVSLFIAVYENFTDYVVSNIESFLCDESIENGELVIKRTQIYRNEIRNRVVDDKNNKDITKASFLWLKDNNAITADDYNMFLKIKFIRNKYAHELTIVLLSGINGAEEVEAFFNMITLYKKITKWWFLNIEA